MPDAQSSTSPANPSKSPPPQSSKSSRLFVLLGLLLLMLGALWYDYKVARPAVENAYDRVAKLNARINSKGGKKYMTSQDVQGELGRAPFHTFNEGRYMVEVYGWRGGLPTKRHKYFAVYTDVAPYIFLKHYKNEIDLDELKSKPAANAATDITAAEVQSDAPVAGGGEPDEKKGKKGDSEAESKAPAEGDSKTGAADASSALPAKEPAAASGAGETAKEKPAREEAQPKG